MPLLAAEYLWDHCQRFWWEGKEAVVKEKLHDI
jgi:hypothetical protein